MSFDAVLGQAQAEERIVTALARDRVGHAWLFTGPDGVGKTLFALEFAKALLCRRPSPPHDDDCPECHMISEDNHPDLALVAAPEGKRVIKIEQARNLGRLLALQPTQSAHRVAIIREAEKLNEEAANSLLKTIEEPADFVVIILTTAEPRNLPDTIRSRCQELRFNPLAPEHISDILSRRDDVDEAQAELAARFAMGSVGTAIASIESECIRAWPDLLERLLNLPKEDALALAAEVEAWLKTAGTGLEPQRERLRELLRLFACAYRDMLLLKECPRTDALLHPDPEPIRRVADRLSAPSVMALVEAVWTARRQVDRNVALPLILEALFLRIGALQRPA